MSSFTIGVIGNPNCGKTTLFNALTGTHQRTGNWPGVTVERLEGDYSFEGDDYKLIDLPGIYSLSAFSEDERITREYLLSNEADLFINVVDANNIERNLFLTTHLLEMNIPMVIILNKKDVAISHDITIHERKLSNLLNIPIEYITSVRKGDEDVVKALVSKYVHQNVPQSVDFSYENEVEEEIQRLLPKITALSEASGANERWVAVKLLEGDSSFEKLIREQKQELTVEEIYDAKSRIETSVGDETDLIIADGRYGFIKGVVASCVRKGDKRKSVTDKIDNIVLNRFWGLPIFLTVMYLTFWVTINVGGALIDFFDGLTGSIFVDGLGYVLESINSPVWLTTFLSTGIGGSIQTLATFIPIIFALFFVLSLLEDSGYMARGAFIMDKYMRMLGLPGKAFVPLLVGFGCTVPAVMATRTLDNKRDRILAVFMAPFMSCGARMPVYALFAAAFFPKNGQIVVFSLYIIGIILSVLTGLMLKKTLFRGESSPFVMELPIYHAPRLHHIFLHTWIKLKGFIIGAGKVLIIVITALGFLNAIGTDGSFGNENSEQSVLAYAGKKVTPIFSSFGIREENWPASVGLFTGLFAKEVIVGTVNSLYTSVSEKNTKGNLAEQVNDTLTAEASINNTGTSKPKEESTNNTAQTKFNFWGEIGDAFKTIPNNLAESFSFGTLSDPMGLKVGNTQNSEEMAKELDIKTSTIMEMKKRFSKEGDATGKTGQHAAFAYLLFVLLYLPCLVAVAATIKEVGKALAAFQMTYSTILAWVVATLYYQITVGHNTLLILSAIVVLLATIASIALYAKRNEDKVAN